MRIGARLVHPAGVRSDGRANRHRDDENVVPAELFGALDRLGGFGGGFGELAAPHVVDRQKPGDGHHVALGPAFDTDLARRRQLAVRLLEPTGPRQRGGVHERRPEDDRHVQGAVVELQRPVQCGFVEAAPALEVHVDRPGQRGTGEARHS